jgi:phage repressor protein C with HTH and peptisase S24 domain
MAQSKKQRAAAARKAAKTRKENAEAKKRSDAAKKAAATRRQNEKAEESLPTTPQEEQERITPDPEKAPAAKMTRPTEVPKDPVPVEGRPELEEPGPLDLDPIHPVIGDPNNPEAGGDASFPAAEEAHVEALRAGATDARDVTGDVLKPHGKGSPAQRDVPPREQRPDPGEVEGREELKEDDDNA